MNKTEQQVQIYHDLMEARDAMYEYIKQGWRVHTCTMDSLGTGGFSYRTILVVYEREL